MRTASGWLGPKPWLFEMRRRPRSTTIVVMMAGIGVRRMERQEGDDGWLGEWPGRELNLFYERVIRVDLGQPHSGDCRPGGWRWGPGPRVRRVGRA